LDVILQHHGTTLTQYFYYKALESGEEVVESNFRYSGPKPKTKESGIILLADTVEAATRTLENKSKEGIENFIAYTDKSKVADVLSALEDFDIESAMDEFSMEDCKKADLYPNIWDYEEEEDEIKEEITDYFEAMINFYRKILETNGNVLVTIY